MTEVVPSRTHVIVRPAWTCSTCARRKIKCDKRVPCSQCIKRNAGHLCTRDEDERPSLNGAEVANPDVSELREVMKTLLRRLDSMESQLEALRDSDALTRASTSQTVQPTSVSSTQTTSHGAENENTSVTLEYLALGKNRRLGILGGFHDVSTSATTQDIMADPLHTFELPPYVKQLLASDQRTALILRQHADSVLWQHACVHAQTFQSQTDTFLSTSFGYRWQHLEPLWISLLLSIIMITVHQMPDELFCELFDTKEGERQRIVDDSLAATLRCLEVGNYMAKPSFLTCQTIAVLSVCGHNVVDSNLLASLLAVGIKTAQTLNLHILGGAEDEAMNAEANAFLERSVTMTKNGEHGDWPQRLISFEMGKRVWWSLVQQDYFAIPFRGVSLVHFRQHDTPFPTNALDIDLDQGLLHVFNNDYPTTTLKQRITSMSSDVLCRFFDNLPRQGARWQEDIQPFETQFMRLLPTAQTSYESDVSTPYVQSLQAYLEISVRHKILVMHRAFCGRKPGDEADVNRSKAVCVDMARGILMHCKAVVAHDDTTMKVMWTTAYHAMAAATVLALDMFALAANASASSVRRMEVQEVRSMLRKMSKRSPIAVRGVTLLDSLLSQFDSALRRSSTPVDLTHRHTAHEDFDRSAKRRKGDAAVQQEQSTSEWNWEDWSDYQSIAAMLQANPDVGRLFDGSLGNPFE